MSLPARAYLLSPTYIVALAGGILATFGASGLIFFARSMILDVRHFSTVIGSLFMAFVGLACGVGGVVFGGFWGDALNKRARGGHARAIGLSALIQIPFGVSSLLVTNHLAFMALTAVAVFFLSVYNGPSAAVVDELGPPQFSATLQAVFMFGIHVLGNAPAPTVIGWIADRSSIPLALQTTVAAFGLSGVLFMITARRQKAGLSFHSDPAP